MAIRIFWITPESCKRPCAISWTGGRAIIGSLRSDRLVGRQRCWCWCCTLTSICSRGRRFQHKAVQRSWQHGSWVSLRFGRVCLFLYQWHDLPLQQVSYLSRWRQSLTLAPSLILACRRSRLGFTQAGLPWLTGQRLRNCHLGYWPSRYSLP